MLKLSKKQKDMLANYALNISVISFGVAAYEQKWLGFIPALAGLAVFYLLTREK